VRRPGQDESFKLTSSEDARMLYIDICKGYSEIYLGENEKSAYWKHPTEVDNVFLMGKRKRYEARAVEEGLQTEEQRIEEVISLELWSEEEEKKWQDTIDTLAWTKNQMSRLALQSQVEHCQRDIDRLNEELKELDPIRSELVGMTSAVHAAKQVNRDFIGNCLFKNEECTKKLFSIDDLEEQTEFMLQPWIHLINVERLWYTGEDVFKRVAVWPFFMNSFFMLDENSISFFGSEKAAFELTNNQADLLSAGRYVKGVLSQTSKSPPEEHYDDLDKLIQWYAMQNAKNRSGKKQGSSRTSSESGVKESRRLG
jgi:hypothetical protein